MRKNLRKLENLAEELTVGKYYRIEFENPKRIHQFSVVWGHYVKEDEFNYIFKDDDIGIPMITQTKYILSKAYLDKATIYEVIAK